MSYGSMNVNLTQNTSNRLSSHLLCMHFSEFLHIKIFIVIFLLLNQTENMRRAIIKFL